MTGSRLTIPQLRQSEVVKKFKKTRSEISNLCKDGSQGCKNYVTNLSRNQAIPGYELKLEIETKSKQPVMGFNRE